MNANIDHNACTGCGLCSTTCVGVFQVEHGKAMVVTNHVPGNLESTCRQVAIDCPARAISVGQAQAIMLTEDDYHYHSWVAL